MSHKHLTTSRAVFQGGGVKAITLVGAIEEAYGHGLLFSALAGTSAGSIIAALLGAGAEPDFLKQKLLTIDRNNLLSPPERTVWEAPVFWRAITCVLPQTVSPRGYFAARFHAFGGAYSSSGLERWLDSILAELIPSVPRPLKFRDLIKPTRIIAADITTGHVKVWSSEKTPDESVAFAVRSSCSIPFFYQPTTSGMSHYVDGGLLSNLPVFAFSDSEELSQDPIIAFSLTDSAPPPKKWDSRAYLTSLYSTLVGGSTRLQSRMGDSFHSINIDVSEIKTTDFSRLKDEEHVSQLLEKGRSAFRLFMSSSYSSQLDARQSRRNPNIVRDESEALSWLVGECEKPLDTLVVSHNDTRWFWRIFPTVLHLLRRRIQICAVCPDPHGDRSHLAHEEQRRRAMKKMGVQITNSKSIPFVGYYIHAPNPNEHRALIAQSDLPEYGLYGKRYQGREDRAILEQLWDGLVQYCVPASFPVLTLAEVSKELFIDRLRKHVHQYSGPHCDIAFEQVPIKRILVLNRYLRSSKYKQIDYLFQAYDAFGLDYFVPAMLYADEYEVSPITPPVLERTDNDFVAIEGNTRVYYAWRNGLSSLQCLVVSGVREALPGFPAGPEQCIVDSKQREGRERIRGFDYNLFRSIEGAIRRESRD